MTALAADNNRVRVGKQYPESPGALGIKANHKVFQGSLVVENAGVAEVATTATALMALGVARKQYDNTGGAASALTVEYDIGAFYFANSSAGDLIAAADTGADCYIVDDNTVAKTDGTGTRSRAGKILGVDATLGVLVRVGPGL